METTYNPPFIHQKLMLHEVRIEGCPHSTFVECIHITENTISDWFSSIPVVRVESFPRKMAHKGGDSVSLTLDHTAANCSESYSRGLGDW